MSTQLNENPVAGNLAQLVEQILDGMAQGKNPSDSQLPAALVLNFVKQLEEDILALNQKREGLGPEVLQTLRQQAPPLSYQGIGATISYLRQTLNGSSTLQLLDKLQAEILLARRAYNFSDEEYAIFLLYARKFKSDKPVHHRLGEFKEVVIDTVLPGYRTVQKNLARVIESVDRTYDSFLATHPRQDPAYTLAFKYKRLEAKYGIKISQVEAIIDGIPKTAVQKAS